MSEPNRKPRLRVVKRVDTPKRRSPRQGGVSTKNPLKPVQISKSLQRPEIKFDDKTGVIILPPIPKHNEPAQMCLWLTEAFHLDRTHPINGGRLTGHRGADAHVELTRLGRNALSIHFEPVRLIHTPARLMEMLTWQRMQTDDPPWGYKTPHCHQIAEVIRLLCDSAELLSNKHEIGSLVRTFLEQNECVENYTTYGSPGELYDALQQLSAKYRERYSPAPYLLDSSTGEIVVAVGDLQLAIRQMLGSGLPRGWLEARLALIDWQRWYLQGFGTANGGNPRPHNDHSVYRGMPPILGDTEDEEPE